MVDEVKAGHHCWRRDFEDAMSSRCAKAFMQETEQAISNLAPAQVLPFFEARVVNQALLLKNQGNIAHKAGSMRCACEAYSAGLQLLGGNFEGVAAKGACVTLLSNRAEALLRTDGHNVVHTAAYNDCTKALEIDPGHTKVCVHAAATFNIYCQTHVCMLVCMVCFRVGSEIVKV
jgi:hypothetical protein